MTPFIFRKPAVTTVAALLIAALAPANVVSAASWIEPDPEPFMRLFTPEAKLSADGQRLVVSGTADCAAADGKTQVSVSVLQPQNLAAARGFSKVQSCTDGEDTFTAELKVREGKPAFAAGPVQACAMAQIGTDEGAPSYDFWCTFVTLVVDDAL